MVALTNMQLYGQIGVASQSILMSIYQLTYKSILVLKESRYRDGEFSVFGYNMIQLVGTIPAFIPMMSRVSMNGQAERLCISVIIQQFTLATYKIHSRIWDWIFICFFDLETKRIMTSWVEEIISADCDTKGCVSKSYACFQQPETLDFLPYLSVTNPNNETESLCLNFNSDGSQNAKLSKKTKKFYFDGLYKRTQKMKHQFSKLIKDTASEALRGLNQTFFIYGTEQSNKDKIIFGESQNPGLLLCILSEIFDACHKKALEDDVTIKLSSSIFNKAKFIDIFGGNADYPIQYKKDYLQGNVLHTVPEIIIRNIKTGLKLLNIILRQLADSREEDSTQNLFITLKLQMDCQRNQEQSTIYCLSKISFIKLANPSVNSSLKGVNKNNIWFVNLLNYLQASALSNHNNNVLITAENQSVQLLQPPSETQDEFTTYIRQTYFKNSHRIYGFVSITNKMNSNQCLTALLFANHLKNAKAQSSKTIINLPSLLQERKRLFQAVFSAILKSQDSIQTWVEYAKLLEDYMNEINYLQFEYSLVLGEACEKLNKYIFTEELEDFFYAKKTNVENSEDLHEAYQNVFKIRNKISIVEKKILEKIGDKVQKKTVEKVFEIQRSLAYHFLLDLTQTNQILSQAKENLTKQSQIVQAPKQKQIQTERTQTQAKNVKVDYSEIQKILKKQKKEHATNLKEGSSSIHSKNDSTNKPNKKIQAQNVDNLECMFKNKNVGMASKKLR